jgi:flagellar basal body rod protein FlgG
MSDPITSIAHYLSADVRALGTLGQNIANLTTPGYRAVQKIESFAEGLVGAQKVDVRDGALIKTGRPTDFALQGGGFFQVQAGDQVYLTRSGQFKVDANGDLVDGQGRAVLGSNGKIAVGADPMVVDEDGNVRQNGAVVDRLAIVDVADESLLQPLGDGLYSAQGGTQEVQARVYQGSLEGSNVDPGHEMVRLMEIQRHAGSVQHAITTYHSAMVAGIDQIGKDS